MIRQFNLDLKFRDNQYAGDALTHYSKIVIGTRPGALKEVNMKRIYEYKNGTIYVTLPESCDREKLQRVTEEFLKKVMYGGKRNGNGNSSRNFREK